MSTRAPSFSRNGASFASGRGEGGKASAGTQKRVEARLALALDVRMLYRDVQHEAVLKDISLSGAAIETRVRPSLGEPVLLYVDKVGRLECEAARLFRGGFAVRYELSATKQARMAERLRAIGGEDAVDAFNAVEPAPTAVAQRPSAAPQQQQTCALSDGTPVPCQVLDISLVGATVRSKSRPAVGTEVTLRTNKGHVVRHTADGFVVEFSTYWDRMPKFGGWANG